MNTHSPSDPSQRLFQVTCRIQQLLVREFGTAIDVRRTMHDARYARDVLLVCDARPGSDLFSLALHFRREQAALNEDTPVGRPGADGGAVVQPRTANPSASAAPGQAFSSTFGSLFGTDADYALPPQLLAQAKRPAWYSPARWLGR